MAKITTTGYGDYTYNSKNRLKRFSHRSRLKKGIRLIQVKEGLRILDYGCGDAMFLNILSEQSSSRLSLIGYEPYLELIDSNKIVVLSDWQDIIGCVKKEEAFDYIVCFEVLEHLSEDKQRDAIEQMISVLADDGTLIISVPIEKGFPSLVKNLIRKRSSGSTLYSCKNIWKSFIGKELPELRQGDEYLSHMGFYYTDLENVLSQYFSIEKRSFSPLGWFGDKINSQVFYKLNKK